MQDWNRHNAIAEFVRTRRKESKMTQSELSDLTGVGLRELERGLRRPQLEPARRNLKGTGCLNV